MAAADPRVAVTAPPGYTGEGRRGGGDERRGGGGGGVFNPFVARSAGGEVRGAAALAALPLGEGAPGAGRARRHAPAAAHPLRP